MFYQKLKNALNDSLSEVEAEIDSFVYVKGKDFSRTRKLSPSLVMSFLISQGGSSSKNECLDFFKLNTSMPSISAINQRRSQLKPSALEKVFKLFNEKASEIVEQPEQAVANSSSTPTYCYIAVDGSTFSFYSYPRFAADSYYVSEGHSLRGFYSLHANALYDLKQRTYIDAYIQPVHEKDEFYAFCKLVDRQEVSPDEKNVFIGDRGYCSYNNMAHVLEKKQFFLFRTKDKERKGLIGNFDFPDSQEFDIDVSVSLTRTHKKSVPVPEGYYRRVIDAKVSFDYIKNGSDDIYNLSFRIVRFPISDNTYECIVTNLPRDEFSPQKIKELYQSRWGIESSFRKLKYTIGTSYYHSYKPEFIEQEVWAKLIAYNATELIINHTCIKKADRKYEYQINFSVAAHIIRLYLSLLTEIESINVMELISKELIPIRDGRQYPRLKTAHFRKPKYLIYRVA